MFWATLNCRTWVRVRALPGTDGLCPSLWCRGPPRVLGVMPLPSSQLGRVGTVRECQHFGHMCGTLGLA